MELSIDNHIVGLIIKHHNVNETQNKYAQRACRMYHAACRTEFQPIDRSYSQLTFFQFFIIFFFKFYTACDIPNIEVDTKERVARHNQPNIYIYIYTTNRQQNTHPIPTTSGETRNKYDTGNYNYCIKNTTAV